MDAPLANKAAVERLFEALGAAFDEGFKKGAPMDVGASADGPMVGLEEMAMIVGSSTKKELHPFLVFEGAMREWIGDRFHHQIGAMMAELENRDFELSYEIDMNDVEDGMSLAIPSRSAAHIGYEAQRHWVKLFIEALTTNANWVDGAAFFGTTRVYGGAGNVISNLTTSALSQTTFNAAIETMSGYVGYNGEPLEVSPTILLHGPKLRTTAHAIVKADRVESGSNGITINNPNQNKVVAVESKRLVGAYDDYWGLLDTSGFIKPALVQQRKIARLVNMDEDSDEVVYTKRKVRYGAHARGAAMLTLPHLAYFGRL